MLQVCCLWRCWCFTKRLVALCSLVSSLGACGAVHFECNVDVKRDAKHQKACEDAHDTVNFNLVQLLLNNI